MIENQTSRSRALAVVPDDRETRALAERIVPAWPKDVSREQAIDIARVALAYGLDPFLGELIPYQGKPYLTFDGRIRIADNHPAYDGYDHGPVVGDELAALQPQPGEVIWKCVVYRRDRGRPTLAYGRAGGQAERNTVAKSDPVTMAQKRAIHRALRAAFPAPIPGLEDAPGREQIRAIHAADDEAGVSREERHEALAAQFGVSASNELTAAQASAYIDARVVDQETGEIAEADPAPIAPPTPKNFTEFWHTVRGWGYATKSALEQAIGEPLSTDLASAWTQVLRVRKDDEAMDGFDKSWQARKAAR